ncbi:MAG: hypothetical protein LQ349_009414, partial [Xanthoria aureola]
GDIVMAGEGKYYDITVRTSKASAFVDQFIQWALPHAYAVTLRYHSSFILCILIYKVPSSGPSESVMELWRRGGLRCDFETTA